MRRAVILAGTILILALVVAGPSSAGEQVRLTWSSGGTGGGWFVMAAGMAKIIEERAPHIKLNVVPGGGTNNQPIVAAKKADLAGGLPPFVMAAYKGQDPYDKPMADPRSLGGSFSDQFMHILAAEDTGVKTVQEFINYPKPIRVGPGKVGVSGEWSLVKVLSPIGAIRCSRRSERRRSGAAIALRFDTGIARESPGKPRAAQIIRRRAT